MNLTELENEFLPVGLIRGGIFLLPPTEALRLIEKCKERNTPILGVEAFKVFGEKIQPQQDDSFDLFGKEENCHAIAAKFLSQRLQSDLWFEVGVTTPRNDG